MSKKGFTLLELIISIGIIATMGLFTTQAIRSAFKKRKKVQTQIERLAEVRSALNVIARDIRKAFHYQDINIAIYNAVQEERLKKKEEEKKKNSSANTETSPSTETSSTETFTPKKQRIVTQFLGGKDQISFTSLSYIRTQKDEMASDQAEVGYYLKDCKGRFNKSHKSQCLWRRISPVIDDNVEEGGKSMVLLENVSKFELKYLAPTNADHLEWKEEWYSNEKGDDSTKEKFPHAVEISLEVKDKNKKSHPISISRVVPIPFPNNEKYIPPSTTSSSSETTPQSGTSGGSNGP
ncbi:MAG: prepilin-type N-terminal cleavage/methylation domain-containing protein [Bdellovibrio sp.]|nr:MAG: prepilin-type N-terminal cleavage/methylation domain-containing protein [Bdellovibrio sp.]